MKKSAVVSLVAAVLGISLISLCIALQVNAAPRVYSIPHNAGVEGGLFNTAPVDTYLLSSFDFDGGDPCSQQGWTGVDLTAQAENYFTVETFRAISGTRSFWCGARPSSIAPLDGYATLPGYGNNWNQILTSKQWAVTGDVMVEFRALYDTEPGYDFVYFEYVDVSSGYQIWVAAETYSGSGDSTVSVIIPASVLPGTIKLRFRVASDAIGSDEDGLWDSQGAFIVDDILITDLGGGSPYVIEEENWEDEDIGAAESNDYDWIAESGPGYGDFSGLFPGTAVLQDGGCSRDLTCLWGFFTGSTDDYGCSTPDPHPEQNAVPYENESGQFIHNEIWSPWILLEGVGSSIKLEYDVYQDLPLENLVFHTSRVRFRSSTLDPSPWRDRGVFYYGDEKGWVHVSQEIGDLIEPSFDYEVQIALGVVDMYPYWQGTYGTGACHSHSPLFDNVRLRRIDILGPIWSVRDIELFQDNFPSDGTATGAVRCDMALDRMPPSSLSIYPGDSIVASVAEPFGGLELAPDGRAAVYCYVRSTGGQTPAEMEAPEPGRWTARRFPYVGSGPTPGGFYQFQMDTVYADPWGMDAVAGKYCFDLKDDLFTPPDTIQFYFAARNYLGIISYWSAGSDELFVPGTTFDQSRVEACPMEFQCLPTGTSTILYVDQCDGNGGQQYFKTAFEQLGISPDRYDVRGPTALAGNGPGSRVRDYFEQVIGVYKTIIWHSGDLSVGTIGDGSPGAYKSPDAQLLVTFLDQAVPPEPCLYMSGDNIAAEMAERSTPPLVYLSGVYINFNLMNRSHTVAGNPITPFVVAAEGSMFDHGECVDGFYTFGGCPFPADFDVLEPVGLATLEMTYRGTGDVQDGAVIAQKTMNASGAEARVVLSGFGYDAIRDDASAGMLDRAHHLYDILSWFGSEGGGGSSPSLAPMSAPANRDALALSYYPGAGAVLFGGNSGYTCQSDTWAWNGTGWAEIIPPSSPPLRHRHSMVYDSVRDKIVLFGGWGGASCFATRLDDTWEMEYAGSGYEWQQIGTAASPPGRFDHGIAYDANRQRTVVFGGIGNGTTYLNDTWEYDASNWTELFPPNKPSVRGMNQMVYDAERQRVVLFGGLNPAFGDAGNYNDTWEWDGSNWTQKSPAHSPAPRHAHGMAYDSHAKRVVLFGGRGVGGTFYNDTWEWDGSDWIERVANLQPGQPAPRYFLGGNGLSYDPVRNVTVLFGGGNGGTNFYGDTWEWNGSLWIYREGQKPPTPQPWVLCQGNMPPTGLDDKTAPVADALFQSYPNPFNPATTIEFSLKDRARVKICIYDVAGRLVKDVIDEERSAGVFTDVRWDGTSNSGTRVASGVYFIRLTTGGFSGVKKVVLLK